MGRFDSGTGTTCSIERLEKVLSDILTDRYGIKIKATMKGEQNDNNNSCRPCPDSGRSARIPDVRNAL